MSETPLWTPSQHTIEHSDLNLFMDCCDLQGNTYQEFWQWSVDQSEDFWNQLWDFCGIIGEKGDITLKDPDKMIGGQFFPEGKINYAQNMLKKRDNDPAIIFRDEKGNEQQLSFNELYDQLSLWVQALKALGVQKGDRIAAYMPNLPETIIACFATASIGAIWSSASPDFGAQGLIDRFGQIEPKILITADGYYYGGKEIDCLEKIKDVQNAIPSLEKTIIVPFINDNPDISSINSATLLGDFLSPYKPNDIEFEIVNFNHPLFIMFSSGTTGIPKCIVHGHGGTLLQHLKEHRLQCDIQCGDRVFYFTTCGWMMWNWLISAIGSGATLLSI